VVRSSTSTSSAPSTTTTTSGVLLPPITGFVLQSLSFISPTTGWVLGESPCSARRCFALFTTVNGGVSWNAVTPPPFSASPAFAELNFAIIRFADVDDGWAWDYNEEVGGTGYQLFATHDGGNTWTPILLGQPNKWGIAALGAGGGHVWAVTFATTASDNYSIFGSPVDEDTWSVSSLTLPLGAGGASGFQMVLESDLGWIVDTDRGTLAGASLTNGAWATWTPPCSNRSYGDAEVAGISTAGLVAFCPPNLVLSNPPPAALYASNNAGESFEQEAATLPSSMTGLAASPSGALFCYDPQGIAASFDGGTTWQTVLGLAGYETTPPPSLGVAFVTPAVGFATTPSGQLFKTVDGGHHWQSVSLPLN